ncbi:hypothetical protein [Phenylobacterium sp.]|uniref:hypothetical protein n=1 Tax=Phenylobacterium sp. TaxID=1871053 RepID=UPI003569CD7E
MGDFSAGAAIGAGFRLIGRHPLAFLAWSAAYLVLGVLPQIGVMALILPEWTRLMQEVTAAGASHSPMSTAEMMRAQGGMMQLQPLSWIAGLLSQSVLLSAIYRAVLYPEDRAFFYLRLGGRELWLGLVLLVLFVMACILAVAVMLPTFVMIGIIGALARGSPAMALLMIPVMVTAFGVMIWVMLRLSLATPMSFDQRAFRLYESWDRTRGHAGKMFGVAFVLIVVVWVVEMALGGVVFGLSGGLGGLERLRGWFQHPQIDLSQLMPLIVGGALVVAVFSTAFFALFGAAWAEIYRELTADLAPD